MSRLSTNIFLPADQAQLVVKLTDLLLEISAQVNQLTEGQVTAVQNAQTVVPTTGTYKAGDFIRNSTPTNAAPILGWLCVITGTPGTWKAVTAV